MSIKSKLIIIFLAGALLPVLFVSALTFYNYKRSIESGHLSNLQNIAAFKAEEIAVSFSHLTDAIEIAQGLYDIKTNLPILTKFASDPANPESLSAQKILDGQLRRMQSVVGLTGIMLVSPEGRVVYSSDPARSEHITGPLSSLEQKSFAEGRHRIYVSDIFFNKMAGDKPEMLIAAPAFGFDGAIIGVIAFEVDMAPVYAIIQTTTGLGDTGEALIGKKSGDKIVYLNPLRHDPHAALNRTIDIGGKVGGPIQAAVRGGAGAGESIDYRGKDVIAAWQHIPSLDWGIVAKIDTDEAFADVIKLQRRVATITIIFLILAGTTAFLIARSIVRQVRKLSEGTQIIGRGNLDYKVGMKTKDEVGQLSRAFDKMTGDLKAITASRDDLDREIVERKNTEWALKRSNDSLEQFAYVASHDLQEPLRIMASYSQLLEKRYKDKLDSDAGEFINYIVDAANRMQKLITDLLSYSRIGRLELCSEVVDCNAVLGKVIYSMGPAMEESGAVITHDELPELMGNESNFVQLFQNLLGNAIKFHGAESPRIHIGAKKDGAAVTFSVSDNGIGIENKYKDRIFMIFQRLHGREKYPGTGIGLSICKKIVETYGGRIWIESVPGKGSTFFFTIPVNK